jgi:hypothetical protein
MMITKKEVLRVAKPVVLIAEELSAATLDALGPDFEVRNCDGANRAELLEALGKGVDAVLIRSATKMDAEAIANLSRNEIAGRVRSRHPLQLCLLVGGMVRCSFNGHDDRTSPVQTKANAMGMVQKQISYKMISKNEVTDRSELVSRIVGDDSNDLSVSQSKDFNTGDYQTISNPFLMPKLFWLDQYGSL